MDFRIKLLVNSMHDSVKTKERRGLMLLREYERLGFTEESRKNKFGIYSLTIDIPATIAKRYPQHFEFTDTVTVLVDSSHTTKENWEDWGSAGMALTSILLPPELIEQALDHDNSTILKIPSPAKLLERD